MVTCREVQHQLRELFDEDRLNTPVPEIRQHLASCAECREVYEQLREMDAVLQRMRPEVPVEIVNSIHLTPEVKRRWGQSKAGKLAAALALTLLLVVGATFLERWHSASPETTPAPGFALDYVESPSTKNTVVILQKEEKSRRYHIVWIF